jgi:hypothetical protein
MIERKEYSFFPKRKTCTFSVGKVEEGENKTTRKIRHHKTNLKKYL